jgi:hypothetical protein
MSRRKSTSPLSATSMNLSQNAKNREGGARIARSLKGVRPLLTHGMIAGRLDECPAQLASLCICIASEAAKASGKPRGARPKFAKKPATVIG